MRSNVNDKLVHAQPEPTERFLTTGEVSACTDLVIYRALLPSLHLRGVPKICTPFELLL